MRRVFRNIAAERRRQDDKWGEQNHDDLAWNAILGEERGEVERAILGLTFMHCDDDISDLRTNLRDELIQLSAVAVAWVEAIDRRPEWQT